MLMALGSFPHSRRAPIADRLAFDSERIIPAFAGSTQLSQMRQLTASGSSPHSRGAPPEGAVTRDFCGSSPHSRGAQHGGLIGHRIDRIIPAFVSLACQLCCISSISRHVMARDWPSERRSERGWGYLFSVGSVAGDAGSRRSIPIRTQRAEAFKQRPLRVLLPFIEQPAPLLHQLCSWRLARGL